MLHNFTLAQLEILHRNAKLPHKGLRPFFADPRAMIALRNEIKRRKALHLEFRHAA